MKDYYDSKFAKILFSPLVIKTLDSFLKCGNLKIQIAVCKILTNSLYYIDPLDLDVMQSVEEHEILQSVLEQLEMKSDPTENSIELWTNAIICLTNLGYNQHKFFTELLDNNILYILYEIIEFDPKNDKLGNALMNLLYFIISSNDNEELNSESKVYDNSRLNGIENFVPFVQSKF